MSTETTNDQALAIAQKLRIEYHVAQWRLTLWLQRQTKCQELLSNEAMRGMRRPSAEQMTAIRQQVYYCREEIAQLQRDFTSAVQECVRLGLALDNDLLERYEERTNVKPNK